MNEERTLTRVCGTDDVPLNEVRRFEVNGKRIAVYHLPLGFFATDDTCSHEEYSLSEGFIDDGAIECPEHGAVFDIQTGKPLTLPATQPIKVYRVVVDGEDVILEDSDG
ncbi:MAG: non-heme iron oxygenase ferredoxin subunit [Actinomycetota bacterium]